MKKILDKKNREIYINSKLAITLFIYDATFTVSLKENTMGKVPEVTDKTFQKEIIESQTPAVVDFWAPWCMPCRMMGPIFEEVAGKYDGKVRFFKMNTDINQSIAIDYGIMSIPSLIMFKGGKEIRRMIGVQPAQALQDELDTML